MDTIPSTEPAASPERVASRSEALTTVATYREVLASLPVVALCLVDGRIFEVNRPDAALFSRPAASGDQLADLFHGESLRLLQRLVDIAVDSDTAEGELDSPSGLFRVVARRLRSAPGVLLSFQGMSAQRTAESALMESLRDKSSFLATVGHQLRTPLTAVIGYADMLSRDDSAFDDQTRSHMARDMTDQAWVLAGIVDDLLTVARAEIGDLAVVSVPVNLTANTAQVIESIGDRGREILVTGDRSITGVGDPAKFRQIVRNLLGNALTHGSEPISVEISATESEARLTVRDRGPGVPAELQDSLFSRFVTTGGPASPGPVGIGLWIARELATLMGGQVSYSRDHGTTLFRVSIPLKTRMTEPSAGQADQQNDDPQ